MYVCRYTATTVSFRYTPLVSWDLLIRHGNHSPCLLLRKTHLFCSFLFRIIDPRLFFNQSFLVFPTAQIKPSSSQWIDHPTTVGSWRIAILYSLRTDVQLLYLWWVYLWELAHIWLLSVSLSVFWTRSSQFLILGPTGWSTPVGGNTR